MRWMLWLILLSLSLERILSSRIRHSTTIPVESSASTGDIRSSGMKAVHLEETSFRCRISRLAIRLANAMSESSVE